MQYWLFKTEPQCYSIDDLAREPRRTTFWDGVRNYQARNRLRDEVAVGDAILVYHSSCPEPGIAGVATVVRAGYPDSTAFDPGNEHYDPKSRRDDPRWYMVDIQLQRKFPRLLTLGELKSIAALAKMELCQQGSRLSIQRVTPGEFAAIEKMAKE